MRIGFLINPVAGMGGRVGLKGTDGLAEEVASLVARPIAVERGFETRKHINELAREARAIADLIG